jgi:hypothetical protein
MWAKGLAGRIRPADIALLLYCFWCTLSLAVIHGIQVGLQSGGILFIETMGPYLLARCWIRDADAFHSMVSVLFKIVMILLPFGLIELYTGQKPLLAIFGLFLPAVDVTMMDLRWGLRRVQGPLEHPILFGVFCGSILAMTHLVLGYQKSLFQRWLRTGLVAATALLCLSSGPTSALVAQFLLLTWNGVLRSIKSRWKMLWGVLAASYLFISAVSSQSVPAFYITHAPLFDPKSAYYRLLIWEYGSATALNHPIFGIGFNEYERPAWMVPSVDMFWLIHAVMHGIPAAILIMFTFLWTALTVGLRKGLDARNTAYRTAYLISMAGFFLVGWTVHFWNGTYVLFLFLLGSGVWFLDAPREEDQPPPMVRRGYARIPSSEKPAARGTSRRPKEAVS